LELCWENGDGFEKLCNFLNFDVPSVSIPHANKAADNQVSKKTLLANRFLSWLNY
jgi:hypothetical protein